MRMFRYVVAVGLLSFGCAGTVTQALEDSKVGDECAVPPEEILGMIVMQCSTVDNVAGCLYSAQMADEYGRINKKCMVVLVRDTCHAPWRLEDALCLVRDLPKVEDDTREAL